MTKKNLKNIVANASWLSAGQLVSGLLAFVQLFLMANHLGVSGFGVYSLSLSLVLFVGFLLSARTWECVSTVIPRYLIIKEHDASSKLFMALLFIELVLSLAGILIIYYFVDTMLRLSSLDESARSVVLVLSLLLPFQSLNEPLVALARVINAYRSVTIIRVVTSVLKTLMITGLCFTDGGVVELSWLIVVAVIFESLAFFTLIIRSEVNNHIRPVSVTEIYASIVQVKSLLLSSSGVASIRSFVSYGDLLLLSMVTTTEAVGVYSLAKNIADKLWALSEPLYQAIFPEVTVIFREKNIDEVLEFVKLVFVRLLGLGALAAVVTVSILTILIPLFWPDYIGSMSVAQILVCQFIAISVLWFPSFVLNLERNGLYFFQQLSLAMGQFVFFYVLWACGVNALIAMAISVVARQLLWMLSSIAISYQIMGGYQAGGSGRLPPDL